MSDLERVLAWTTADERFVERVTARMDPDRKKVLIAVVETRGDLRALSQRLAPDLIERLRARAPQPAARAVEVLSAPLARGWSPPPDLGPDRLAEQFLQRYGVRLDELTGRATRAAAAAKGAAAAMATVSSAREAATTLETLEAATRDVERVVSACAHPEGASWLQHAREVAREGMDVVDAARGLRATVSAVRAKIETVERALTEWVEAPPEERAATAEGMAVRVRAASAVVADMRDQLLQLAR